ncbi:MAG: hypothetical protein COA42_11295 [Alteromonadaceae bacterium]|nr:MAG: hypothetical protein COA42_11295 [Alteromonadaceae bacterium]
MKTIKTWLASLAHEHETNVDEAIKYLGDSFPLLKALKTTEQDPQWHAEGDVHIHTDMVLSELYTLLKGPAAYLSADARQLLVLGALFHDIAKPLATKRREINGAERVIAPQHEGMGRSYLAYRLCEFGLERWKIQALMGLVGEHQMPKLLVIKNRSRGDYWRLARKANHELLYWLEVADMKGRICEDLHEQLSLLDEFKLFSEEYGVWGNTAEQSISALLAPLISDLNESEQAYVYGYAQYELERDTITIVEEAIAKTYPHRSAYSDLVILCGPSGSGKSSWIKQNIPQHRIISLDDIRAEVCGDRSDQNQNGKVLAIAKERLRESLRIQQAAVWDATSLRLDFRDHVAQLGRNYHALVTLVVFQLPPKVIFDRNRNRAFAVPDNVLDRQIETLQWPTPDEVHRYIVVDETGKSI